MCYILDKCCFKRQRRNEQCGYRYSLHSSNEQEMIKKVTASVPDHNDRVQLSGNAKVATCGGRLLVSDHQHVGLKLHEDRHVQLLHYGCIYSPEEEQRQEKATHQVSLRTISMQGKLMAGARGKAGMMKPFTATNPYQYIQESSGITLCVDSVYGVYFPST